MLAMCELQIINKLVSEKAIPDPTSLFLPVDIVDHLQTPYVLVSLNLATLRNINVQFRFTWYLRKCAKSKVYTFNLLMYTMLMTNHIVAH
jgi:hypothetical protein